MRSLELELLEKTSRCIKLYRLMQYSQMLPHGVRFFVRLLGHLVYGGPRAFARYIVSKLADTYVGGIGFSDLAPKLLRSRTFYGAEILGSSCLKIFGVLDAGPEFRLTRLMLKILREDEIFYDIGAHAGFYTLLVSAISQSGRIYAFEPNPYVYRVLKNSVAKVSNITALPYAVSDRTGVVELKIPLSGYTTISSIREVHRWTFGIDEKRVKRIKVPSISIDSFVSKMKDPPTFIKIDVEGAEDLVVRGAKRVVEEYRPKISMEIWRIPGETPHKKAAEILYSLGCKSYAITSEGNLVEDDFEKLRSREDLGFADNILFIC